MEADEEEDKKGKEKENKVLLSLLPPQPSPHSKGDILKGGVGTTAPTHTQKKKALFDFLLWDLLSLLKCLIGSINF